MNIKTHSASVNLHDLLNKAKGVSGVFLAVLFLEVLASSEPLSYSRKANSIGIILLPFLNLPLFSVSQTAHACLLCLKLSREFPW